MLIDSEQSVLLLIDIQGGLLPAIDGGGAVRDNAAWLVELAGRVGVPVLVTEHCSAKLGGTEANLRCQLDSAAIVEKTHFSAVTEGGLLALPPAARKHWVVGGTEAHVCVLQTVLDLLASGRSVFVVDDAVGSRHPRDKELALARMRQNGAEIVSREMVAFEWLAKASHPAFRGVLGEMIR